MTPHKDDERQTTVPVATPTVTATRTLAQADVPGHAETLRVGERIGHGRFEMLERLGHGGMGVVYAAIDHELGVRVALKTLSHAGAADIYRLKNEFRALSGVTHPNLVTLHELFHDNGRWFFSMELVDGVSLIDWVRCRVGDRREPGGELDLARLRAALPQLIAAIETIHLAGQLHRDLKPSNVLVTGDGQVKVLDLGLTVPCEPGGVGRTLEHEGIIGTPAYMAPEQVTENVATTASDFYSLGVMLFEALTGQLPFTGSVGSVLMAKQVRDAPLISSITNAPKDLVELTRALLSRSAESRPDAAGMRAALGESPDSTPIVTSVLPPLKPLLVGRDRELEQLRGHFQASLAGTLSVTFVSGPSGMGKTTLLETATKQLEASHGAIVLSGRCYEREAVPFKAFDTLVDDLSRYLRRLSAPDANALLPRDVRTLAHMFPVLDRVPVVAEAPERVFESALERRDRAFAAFGELLGRIRDRRPLVVHIDDLQWCDAESALFLASLLEHGHLPPMLLVLSYRAESEYSDALVRVKKACARSTHRFVHTDIDVTVHALAVGPLARADSETLAGSLLQPEIGPPSRVVRVLGARIAQESEGNPLFVGELCRYVDTHRGDDAISLGDLSLSQALRARIEQLPPAAQRLLEVVSVSARPLPLSIARRAAGLGVSDTGEKDQLQAALMIRMGQSESGPALVAYHDRVRETVQEGLSKAALTATHAHLANALESDRESDPEALAHHLWHAGRAQDAAVAALTAARRAMQVLAFERAARLLRMAQELGTFGSERKSEIAVSLASALSNAGRGPEASEAYLEASRLLPERAIELQLQAARQLATTGYLAQGLGLVEALLKQHGLQVDDQAHSLATQLDRLWLRMRGYDVRPRALKDIPRSALLRTELAALCQSGFVLVDQARAHEFALRTLKLALDAGHAPRCVRMVAVLASLEANAGNVVRSAKLIERAERMLHEKVADTGLYDDHEIEATRIEVEQEAGITAMFTGDFEHSVHRLDTALDMHRRWSLRQQFMITACESFRSWSLFHLGRLRELRASIVPEIELAEQRGDLLSATMLAGATGVTAYLSVDDADKARARLEWAQERWPGDDYDLQRCFLLLGLTWVDLYERRRLDAWQRWQTAWHAFNASPVVRVSFTMRTYGNFVSALAAAAAIEYVPTDERDGLRRHVQRNAEALEQLHAFPPARGHALALKAVSAAVQHDPGTAQRELSAAVQSYREHGYVLFAAAAEQRLATLLGGRPGRELLRQSDRRMGAAGITRPDRLADMLLPID